MCSKQPYDPLKGLKELSTSNYDPINPIKIE